MGLGIEDMGTTWLTRQSSGSQDNHLARQRLVLMFCTDF